ncbi:MAG: hypothetical protein KAW56_13525 [Candidatus Marinimicrobia bacterium]|nr:hypothetical protein [Candidatus Neomarinimicrobiota bacterium]
MVIISIKDFFFVIASVEDMIEVSFNKGNFGFYVKITGHFCWFFSLHFRLFPINLNLVGLPDLQGLNIQNFHYHRLYLLDLVGLPDLQGLNIQNCHYYRLYLLDLAGF